MRFNRDVLNEASARLEWTCTWNFGDSSPREAGWEVFHNYEEPGNARSRSPSLTSMQTSWLRRRYLRTTSPCRLPKALRLGARGGLWRFTQPAPETWLELGHTAIELALPMLSLMVTARQQVEILSFLGAVGAIVALAFRVDTARNLALQHLSGS